jgi:two-component system sensor histidine kinase GlrK
MIPCPKECGPQHGGHLLPNGGSRSERVKIMKWSIFARLMTGYLALLVLATGVSVYAIIQLRYVRDVTQSVILVDNPLLELHKNLSDALFSETRFEKKFVITRDSALYDGFLKSKADFEQNLRDATRLADTSDLQALLKGVADLHSVYQDRFAEEAGYLRSGRKYSAAWYSDEEDRIVNALIEQLLKVRALSQKSIVDKVKLLREAGRRATKAAMITTAAAIAIGIVLSVLITWSITVPLGAMKKKTREISDGIYEADLKIASPPEIAALGRAFNFMCEKLKEVDKMKSDFYALMSHELRTPLTSIKEGTNLFLEGLGGEVTEKQKKLLSIIAEESNRLIELVNSLLDISRLEAGMVAYNFAKADINPLIARALTEIAPLAESKRIRIDKDLRELPALSLDTERILQVLRNLIGNALKFTHRGGVVTVSSQPAEGGVSISVRDTGPGIPKEHASVIFDKYRQAVVAGPHKLQGTGLGLAIVKHIVQDHGGKVWVESEAGRGCTFTMVLPA